MLRHYRHQQHQLDTPKGTGNNRVISTTTTTSGRASLLPHTPKRGLTGTKRSSLSNLRETRSSTTADSRRQQLAARKLGNSHLMINMGMKRRSTGCLRRASVTSTASQPVKKKWRSPGRAEIPNIFGNDCFLKYEPAPSGQTCSLRASDPQKNISKRPWKPAGICPDIPQLPPLVRSANKFERKLRKALPGTTVSTLDPYNKYEGFTELGAGVNGPVVGAVHRYKKDVVVAVKRCHLYPDPAYRTAVVRELRIMAMDHPNLVRLREVTLWRSDIWITMDLMRCSVFAVLCQRGLPEECTIYITCEVLKALVHLHSKGYIHRDIKCENLLIGWDGQIKLADFGLSTRTNRVNFQRLGTCKWMAPEVIREEPYNEKIDMWSLGIAIIEMMDRVPPHHPLPDDAYLFATILSEPSPTFVYSYPSMYMRGLVAWLLDPHWFTRPPAKDVLREIQYHIDQKLLSCCDAAYMARFVHYTLTTDQYL